MNQPAINVTPLIDVLLVLLIIFMVVSPLKPSSFKTKIPAEPSNIDDVKPHPDTLAVNVLPDGTLLLNNEQDRGTVAEPKKLIARLRSIFEQRVANGAVSQTFADDPDRPVNDRVERTVFIKAPRTTNYGSVAKVVDAVKLAGAYPISLQIDRLD